MRDDRSNSRSAPFSRGRVAGVACVIVGGVLARRAHAQEFLSPEQAFRVRMTEERGAVVLHFAIADGYRLYGDRFRVAVMTAARTSVQFSTAPARSSLIRVLGVRLRCSSEVTLRVPVNAREMFGLTVTYQGCAINQICYPPMQRTFPVIAAALLSQSEASR